MRSLAAIICFTAFFCLQYGKLMDYWHCRIVTPACDCEKKMAHKHDPVKEKTEEIIVFFEAIESIVLQPAPIAHTSFYREQLPNIYSSPVFQPPRMW